MRTLLITDLHLNSKVPGVLSSQVKCVKNIIREEKPTDIIIMGDVFMHRKPSPSELLACKEILEAAGDKQVVVIRGNHDSETKADDGVTALSVFDGQNIKIVTQTFTDKSKKRVFIPHYENEEHIIYQLEMAPEGYTVFGHFGYAGCLNSVGDADFSLSLRHFGNTTYLGHIHGFREGQGGLRETSSTVTCLGTPYTTNFGEAFKDCFYAILEGDKVEYKRPLSGPRHLVHNAHQLEENLEEINDPRFTTFLRVIVDVDHFPIPYEKLNVHSIDVKYSPVFNEEDLSSYKPERDLFAINEMIITDYVEQANSTIPAETLMEGYRLLQDEN
jgi:predicted phosphodiesterase